MNILIIHAHENPDSFSTALANKAKSVGERLGHEVIISDLYAQGFNPVGAKHDFKGDSGTAYYKYAMEQLHASKTNGFSDEVQLEIDKLLKADFLIFNFPLWWYDMPAILKGWVDRGGLWLLSLQVHQLISIRNQSKIFWIIFTRASFD